MQRSFPLERRSFITGTVAAGALRALSGAADTPAPQAFRLAAITMRSAPASPRDNLRTTEAWVGRAKAAGARMACFPELSVTGYLTAPGIWDAAEPVPGPSTRDLERMARASGMLIAAGVAEKDRGIVYDTYVFCGPDGYLGKSRKMHIPPPEVGYWRGGGEPPVIDLGFARAGVNICFDNWLPESSRLVALQGAEIVFAPYVWAVRPAGDHASQNRAWKAYARKTFPARAIDNGVFFVALNACGPSANGSATYHGNPVVMAYSPLGDLIAESPDAAADEVMVTMDIDLTLLAARRSQSVFHPRFRRPEIYRRLAEGDIGPQNPR